MRLKNSGNLPPKKIFIVRHGQTDYNLNGIVQGRRINASLNDRGRAQAQAFYDKFQDTPFQWVFTSALIRTQESIQKFLDKGIQHTSLAGLDEISWGNYDGKKIVDDDYYWSTIRKWKEGQTDLRPTEGESPEDVAARQREAFQVIMESDHKLVLVCMHGRAMRILLAQMTNKPLAQMDDFKHHNLGLYVVNFEKGEFEIEVLNSIEHLEHNADLVAKPLVK